MKIRYIIICIVCSIAGVCFGVNAMAGEKPRTIAITQIVAHPSADSVRQGILDVLKEQGYEDGKNVNIVYENAQGNMTTALQIAQKFVSMSPDVIIPITTPSSQAVASVARHSNIPVVFAAVTDPLNAKLVSNMQSPGANITGTTEFPPIAQQLSLIKEIMPKIKRLGVIYNPAEINSVKIVHIMKSQCFAKGITLIERTASSSAEVPSAAQSIISEVDAVYVPLDNMVLSAMNSVLKVGFTNRVPIFSSDPDSVKQGALASVSYTQYEAGRLAGEMVMRIFAGEHPGKIPVSSPATAKLYVNQDSARKLLINLSDKILKEAQH